MTSFSSYSSRANIQGTSRPAVRQAAHLYVPSSPSASLLKPPQSSQGSITQFLQKFQKMPPKTCLVGFGDDDMPVLFDMTDARPGPIAILGNAGCGKKQLIEVIVRSLIQTNEPSNAQFVTISEDAAHLDELAGIGLSSGHCLAHLSYDDPDTDQTIIDLAVLAEKRMSKKEKYFPVLLIMDGFQFIQELDMDTVLNFEWLLKNGPDVQIWPVAIIETKLAAGMGRWLRHFKTRIIGQMPNKSALRLGAFTEIDSERLVAGKQFAVRIGNEWLKFWIPKVQ